MRQGVGMLLAELMRIKAEGDYAAIKALVDTYGVHFDPALRDQVVARFKTLNLPAYWAGVNPELTASRSAQGAASVRRDRVSERRQSGSTSIRADVRRRPSHLEPQLHTGRRPQ